MKVLYIRQLIFDNGGRCGKREFKIICNSGYADNLLEELVTLMSFNADGSDPFKNNIPLLENKVSLILKKYS